MGPPEWAARIAYAERFGVEPHTVNPPLRWWKRIGALDYAKAQRQARELVERVSMAKAPADAQRLYNDLMLAIRRPPNGN